MGWMSEETICPSGGGDVVQLSCCEGNIIIRDNIFDKRGRSAKMSLLISYSKKWYFGRQEYSDITRNVEISWNTFLLGFGLEGGYPCDGGRDNRGAYSCMQLYQMDTLWFHNNTLDGTKWEYDQTYGLNELHSPAFTVCEYNIGCFYDNLFLGCSQENTLASGVSGAKLYFINNTILPAYRTSDITFDYIFLTGSAEVYSYNNFTLGNENLSFSFGSGTIIESNNIEEFKGSGEYGDTASFALDYAIPQLSGFNLKPTDESVHLIDEGYAFEFTTAGWWDSIPTDRFDIDSLGRPIDDYDIGAFEYDSVVAGDPPSVVENVYFSLITDSSAIVEWQLNELATGYKIYLVELFGDNEYLIEPETDIGNVLEYLLSGLESYKPYAFGINAYNENGDGLGMGYDFQTLCSLPQIGGIYTCDDDSLPKSSTIFLTDSLYICRQAPIGEDCEPTVEYLVEGATQGVTNAYHWQSVGVYDYTVIVTNPSGSVEEQHIDEIIVTSEITAPTPAFHSDKQSARIGQSIHFINETPEIGTMAYTWSFGGTENVDYVYLDQTDKNSVNPVVKYLTAGTYDVTLSAENEAGASEEIKENYLTILPGLLKRFLYFLR
jgi:hypothetical protein